MEAKIAPTDNPVLKAAHAHSHHYTLVNEPDSAHIERCALDCARRGIRSGNRSRERFPDRMMVEASGIEPLTYCVQSNRSPS